MAEGFQVALLPSPDYSRKDEVLDALVLAVEESRIVHVTYRSAQSTEPVTRDLLPYSLLQARTGGIYLVAWAPEHGEVRHYKLTE
jgi:predicted DNA-binding transcriptional regulator YafY